MSTQQMPWSSANIEDEHPHAMFCDGDGDGCGGSCGEGGSWCDGDY